MRKPRSLTCVLTLSCISALALGACASAPPPRTDSGLSVHRMSPSEEAEAIEAAKRHPIATTYERPHTADALPVAPPKIPAEPAPAEPPPVAAEAPPPPRDQVVIVGNEPPPAESPSATAYRWPDTTPDAEYADSPYVYVDGAWVARPSFRGYVETPWVGVSVGRPWGWGWGYPYRYGYGPGYGYGYRSRNSAGPRYYSRPPAIVYPSRSAPPVRYYDRSTPRGGASVYQSSPRRQVYVAPSAPRGGYSRPSAAPRYRAPAAAPRSGAPYRAPAAAPRSSGGGGGRRTVHVR